MWKVLILDSLSLLGSGVVLVLDSGIGCWVDGHGFAEGRDGFYCRIGASERWRGAEEGAGCGEEAGGGTEKGGHCGDRVR